jgi:hypothetical protein
MCVSCVRFRLAAKDEDWRKSEDLYSRRRHAGTRSSQQQDNKGSPMSSKKLSVLAVVCAFVAAGAWTGSAGAQTAEVKDKPPMYSYVSNWTYPRAHWGDVEKNNAATDKIMEKAMAAGVLVGYGSDSYMIHETEGFTHDNWFSSMSMAGLLNTLEEVYKAGGATSALLVSATKHSDSMWVSRYYNWHSGSWKGAYTRVAVYKLKPGAPNDAVEMLSKNVYVPVLEKLLADGALVEYEIDVQAVHTDSPDLFMIVILAPTAEGLDKWSAAVRDAGRKNPLIGATIGALTDSSGHHDYLSRTTAAYK